VSSPPRTAQAVICWQRRVAGVSERNIAAELGITPRAVRALWDRLITDYVVPETSRVVGLELARYDAWTAALAGGIQAGDPASVRAAVTISEARRKLLGVDAPPAPAQVAVTVRTELDARVEGLLGEMRALDALGTP
jgi:hypothetical protein